jgi:hypothetical protein
MVWSSDGVEEVDGADAAGADCALFVLVVDDGCVVWAGVVWAGVDEAVGEAAGGVVEPVVAGGVDCAGAELGAVCGVEGVCDVGACVVCGVVDAGGVVGVACAVGCEAAGCCVEGVVV